MRSVPFYAPDSQYFIPLDASGPDTGTGLDEWNMVSRQRCFRAGEITVVLTWPGYASTSCIVSSDGSLSNLACYICQYIPAWLETLRTTRGSDRRWDLRTVGASTSNLRILRLWLLSDGSVAPEFALP